MARRRTFLARTLVLLHRSLGIVCGVLFVAWFASGAVLLWRGMPELAPGDRLAGLRALDLSRATVEPVEAVRSLSFWPESFTVGMVGEQPVYRFAADGGSATVFADSGERLTGMSTDRALELARELRPEHAATARWERRVVEPDQWTLQSRGELPAHRIRLGDPAATVVYVSERSGGLFLETDRASRLWGFAGAVIHWLYFTPLRRHGEAWLQLLIGLSALGVLLCLSGLAWGLWVMVQRRRPPYVSWMRWHHVAGLIFGLTSLLWIFSGLLSLEPWGWHPGIRPTERQRAVVRGGPLALERFDLDSLRAALAAVDGAGAAGRSTTNGKRVRELEAHQFRGRRLLVARSTVGRPLQVVSLDAAAGSEARGATGVELRDRPLERDALLAAARETVPGADIAEVRWLDDYDAYYYASHYRGEKPLPVLRVRFDDRASTALYFDGRLGTPLHREQRLTRWNRWLYHGLHSWDLPALRRRPVLRRGLMAVFLAGGLMLSLSSAPAGLRRVARRARGSKGTDGWGGRSGDLAGSESENPSTSAFDGSPDDRSSSSAARRSAERHAERRHRESVSRSAFVPHEPGDRPWTRLP